MATRIYLPQTGAAPITPAFGTWTETSGADRIAGVATRIGSAMTSKTQAHAATAANSTFLSRQYAFGPLAAQTIPISTIKGTIRVLESAVNDNLDAMRLVGAFKRRRVGHSRLARTAAKLRDRFVFVAIHPGAKLGFDDRDLFGTLPQQGGGHHRHVGADHQRIEHVRAGVDPDVALRLTSGSCGRRIPIQHRQSEFP